VKTSLAFGAFVMTLGERTATRGKTSQSAGKNMIRQEIFASSCGQLDTIKVFCRSETTSQPIVRQRSADDRQDLESSPSKIRQNIETTR
jgi:hypothetical protein